MMARVAWQGVFPAVTAQFKREFFVAIDTTARAIEARFGLVYARRFTECMSRLHLDTGSDRVPRAEAGERQESHGTWQTRARWLPVQGDDLAHVENVMNDPAAKRPTLVCLSSAWR